MSITCPICGVLSPDEALQCDCGYRFETGLPKPPSAKEKVLQELSSLPFPVLVALLLFFLLPEGVDGFWLRLGIAVVSAVLVIVVRAISITADED